MIRSKHLLHHPLEETTSKVYVVLVVACEIAGPYEVVTIQRGSVADKVVSQAAGNPLVTSRPRILRKPDREVRLSGPGIFPEESNQIVEVSFVPVDTFIPKKRFSRPVSFGVGVVKASSFTDEFLRFLLAVPRPSDIRRCRIHRLPRHSLLKVFFRPG